MSLVLPLAILMLAGNVASETVLNQSDEPILVYPNRSYSLDMKSKVNKYQSFYSEVDLTPSELYILVKINKKVLSNLYFDKSSTKDFTTSPDESNYLDSYFTTPKSTDIMEFTNKIKSDCNISFTIYLDESAEVTLEFQITPKESENRSIPMTVYILIGSGIFLIILLSLLIILLCKHPSYRYFKRCICFKKMAAKRPIQSGETTQERPENHHRDDDDDNGRPTRDPADLEIGIMSLPHLTDSDRSSLEESVHGKTFESVADEKPEENESELTEDTRCIICFSVKKNIRFEPCNHIAACQMCSLRILELQSKCPLCRGEIVSISPATQINEYLGN